MALVTLQAPEGRIYRLTTPFTIGCAADDTIRVVGDFVFPHHWKVFEHQGAVLVYGRRQHPGENRMPGPSVAHHNLADLGNLHVGLITLRVLSIRLPQKAREVVVLQMTQELQAQLIRCMDLSQLATKDHEPFRREITAAAQELLRMRTDLTERERHQILHDVLSGFFGD